jgi:hypothetical protein
MTQIEAITELFVAYGAQRNEEQAKLYLTELQRRTDCSECIEATCTALMRSSKRLPALAQLLEELDEQLRSDNHTRHVTLPQLAPHEETTWRTEGVNLIVSFVDGDRDLAAFIAAELWWSHIRIDSVVYELKNHPIWIQGARAFLEGRDVKVMTQKAFERARWAAEHPDDELMPDELVELVEVPA